MTGAALPARALFASPSGAVAGTPWACAPVAFSRHHSAAHQSERNGAQTRQQGARAWRKALRWAVSKSAAMDMFELIGPERAEIMYDRITNRIDSDGAPPPLPFTSSA